HGGDFEKGRLLKPLVGHLHLVRRDLIVSGSLNGSIAEGGKRGRHLWRVRR
ncbi:MAG: hypothetical protein QOJ33_2198, partial [Chloroflexota bacterium]|nr:hypothetical protein [Chloroflexota bacterium]